MITNRQDAIIYNNADFIFIGTCSGRGRVRLDPEGKQLLFAPDSDVKQLGQAVLEALAASRFLSLEETGTFFNLEISKRDYDAWVERLLNQYQYKSKRNLFKKMKHCLINKIDSQIIFSPTKQDKLEAWTGSGFKDSDKIIVPVGASEEALGKALLDCLDKCIVK